MRAFTEVIGYILLSLIILTVLAIVFPYFLRAGKSSAKMTKTDVQQIKTVTGGSLVIWYTEYNPTLNKTCVLIKNSGDTKLEGFYVVVNGTVYNFSYVYVTNDCRCFDGLNTSFLAPGYCGYFLIPGNIPYGSQVVVQSGSVDDVYKVE